MLLHNFKEIRVGITLWIISELLCLSCVLHACIFFKGIL